MLATEIALFQGFLRSSDRYVEFGSGGSTCMAATLVRTSILSVDSSEVWLSKVAGHCSDNALRIVPELIHADIGATGDWGVPIDGNSRDRWPSYHRQLWSNPRAAEADLYMVDERFRVACFMQILLHCDADALIMVHDYSSRKQYHVMREAAREIATVDDMSVFLPLGGGFRRRAREILSAHEFDWA
jgi:hypothetical protein